MNSENHLIREQPDKKLLIFIGVGIISLLLGVIFENSFHHGSYSEKDIGTFENALHKKELLLYRDTKRL